MTSLPFSVIAIADLETLGSELVGRTQAAVAGGLAWVSLRARGVGTEERVRLGAELRSIAGLFLTVHGDPEACRRLSAPGLHLPSRGFDVSEIRGFLPRALLGVSCHDRGELEAAVRAGADYAFLSPVFAPASKPLRGETLGVDGFRQTADGVAIPVLALGGVTPERLPEVARAGAAGAAVLGTLFLAPDIEGRAQEYYEAAVRWFGDPAGRPETDFEERTRTTRNKTPSKKTGNRR